MLRKKELLELERLQKKYCDDDDIYRLIDLSAAVYRKGNTQTLDTLSELRFDLAAALTAKINEQGGGS